ncbi:Phospholipid hydroperoxide glutathione peroxidase, mitochondrial [Trebouxia sp. C0009 RCD-2024]
MAELPKTAVAKQMRAGGSPHLQAVKVGVHLVRDSAANVASHVPLAGLFGSSDVNNSYENFHQLKATDIDGNEVNFADLNGKVVLVVNVATY